MSASVISSSSFSIGFSSFSFAATLAKSGIFGVDFDLDGVSLAEDCVSFEEAKYLFASLTSLVEVSLDEEEFVLWKR